MPRIDFHQQRLLEACRVGNLQAAQQAVLSGAVVYDVVDHDRNGLTALHLACQYNHLTVVAWIVQHCDVHVQARDSIFYSTPLMLAAEAGHAPIVQFLLSSTAACHVNQTDAHGWTALHLACLHEHEEVVDLLLRHSDTNVNCVDEVTADTPLLKVCLRDATHYHLAHRLIHQGGADVQYRNTTGWTALERAAYHGQQALVRLLVAAGASAHDALWTAVCKYAYNLTMLETLCRTGGANPTQSSCINDKDGATTTTPLHYLCRQARQRHVLPALALLLRYTADCNVLDSHCQTPLDVACCHGHESVAQLLLQHGAQPRHSHRPKDAHLRLVQNQVAPVTVIIKDMVTIPQCRYYYNYSGDSNPKNDTVDAVVMVVDDNTDSIPPPLALDEEYSCSTAASLDTDNDDSDVRSFTSWLSATSVASNTPTVVASGCKPVAKISRQDSNTSSHDSNYEWTLLAGQIFSWASRSHRGQQAWILSPQQGEI